MHLRPGKLSRKIVGMLLVFFLVATLAIALTLAISWQLEGVAAAINDAGSQRMRSYRIAHLMGRGVALNQPSLAMIGEEMKRFEQVLGELKQGNPERPLSPPRNGEVVSQLQKVEGLWRDEIRPLVAAYLASQPAGRNEILDRYDASLEPFVMAINDLVLAMERSYAHDTNLLRTLQAALILLAMLGTAVLITFLIRLVIRPVSVLDAGIRQMASNELSVRLPVTSDDELGNLALGFNHMAAHLENVYNTLEQRVEEETRRLAMRNRDLGILYSITAFLSEPAPLQELCEGFLFRIKTALGADGGAVRLYQPNTGLLYMLAHDGLSEQFIAREANLACGECLCGQVMSQGGNAHFQTDNPPEGMKLRSCMRDGFATATAFGIMADKQRLGVFNIYFRRPQALSEQEIHLLETLGHHLGVAIENQRLKLRDKQLAISEERNLLAQELHDSIAQGLAFLNIQVQLLQDSLHKGRVEEALQTATQLREGVQESYDDVRELLVHFRTRVNHADLDTAIAAALDKFEGQTGIQTHFAREVDEAPPLQSNEIQIMHIVQESLSNIRKHAGASEVQVLLRRDEGRCIIRICDDGVGFDPINDPNVRSDRHVGLKIMRERAHRIGGECKITSQPGAGACIELNVPAAATEGV